MVSKLLQLNNNNWGVTSLGENSILLDLQNDECDTLSIIHNTVLLIEGAYFKNLVDVVPAYKSIALIFRKPIHNLEQVISQLQELAQQSVREIPTKKIIVPVCYNFGLDWEEVERETGLQRSEIIRRHVSQTYRVAMMGFIPGFVFLDGLDKSIKCPRKKSPRMTIPKGSIGIGGIQTGIYSLESPGGWQIIGRTPLSFFDVHQTPPSEIQQGVKLEFQKISEETFKALEASDG